MARLRADGPTDYLDHCELAHHSLILVLEDMAVVHEWHLGRGGIVEANKDLSAIFHENYILPAGLLGTRFPAVVGY